MKKLVILFMFLPFSLLAKYFPGSVTLNNEKVLKGSIEIPSYNDDYIKFKDEKTGKKEKLSIDDVKSFEITEDNKLYKYTTLRLSNPKFLKPKDFKIDDKKSWVCIMKEGKITVYQTCESVRGTLYYRYYFTQSTSEKEDEIGKYIYTLLRGWVIGDRYKELKYYLNFYFDKTCPKFAKAIVNEDLDNIGMEKLVDVYDKICGENE
ncbi:MAG: hypothetical protein NTZ33_07945 [Bacteroidetes bacterium]|nr:hypothetical protein [Bacteroidota bacterium]